MKNLFILCTVALLVASLQTIEAQQTAADSEKLLARAHHKATLDGDLRAAIAEYHRIVAAAGNNRSLAVRALVHMAECYQKLGDAEARKIYQRIARNYADQADAAALARLRLTTIDSGRSVATTTLRKIWAGPDVDTTGRISPDGRYLSYVNWDTGDLAVHDFSTGANRLLTNKVSWLRSEEFAENSVISRDGKQVAYAWFNGTDRYQLRVLNLQQPGFPEPRLIFDNPDVAWIAPHDWSNDGRLLAVALSRVDNSSQIGFVNVRDGSLHILKSVDWRAVTRMAFSPDGKYVAFDLPSGDQVADKTDVFVVSVDGSAGVTVASGPGRDDIMGWSPDGAHVLFSSDRSGTTGLWAQRFDNGRPTGSPKLLKPDIGGTTLGVSNTGRLFIGANVGDLDIHVASVDFATGRLLVPPIRAVRTSIGSSRHPAWSPDGKYLSYVFTRRRGEQNQSLAIRSVVTGEVRELPSRLVNFYFPQWAPDGRSLVTNGTDVKGRGGIYEIDSKTGEAMPLLLREPGRTVSNAKWSSDGRKLYHIVRTKGESAIVERDMAAGTDRELLRGSFLGAFSLSPDGKYIGTRHEPEKGISAILIVPVQGGEPRELMRVQDPFFLQGVIAWAPDAASLVTVRASQNDLTKNDVLLVPINGASPKPLEVPGFRWGALAVHPDGRQVAYLAGKNAAEVWVLENFLPR